MTEGAFVTINRRQLAVRFVAEDVVWFDFDVVCGLGRAVPDYIEIAKLYQQSLSLEFLDYLRGVR